MSRKLDTGDQQDIRIINDAALVIAPTRFISAWGDTSYVGYHGLNRARGDVRLFGDTSAVEAAEVLEESLSTKADGSLKLQKIAIEFQMLIRPIIMCAKHSAL